MSLPRRLLRVTPGRALRELRTQSARLSKWTALRRRFGRHAPSRPLFVVGCHRSGTNMVMWTLERSPEVWVYHEHVWSPAFRDYRLRSTATVDRLIRRCPAPVVAFKPVCDSHLADRYLERHEGARAIWIYRRYPDVANSAVRNWGEHHKDILRWLVRGDSDRLAWRGERLAPDIVDLVVRCFHEGMSPEEAASLTWYMRTRLYFDLALDADERVLLTRYEDLVGGDEAAFRRVFDFAGARFDPAFLGHVFGSSIQKEPFPAIDPRIREACEALMERLDAAYGRRSAASPAGAAASGR